MPYVAALTDAISRIRFAVGDTAAAELLPDATYSALLSQTGTSELRAARAAAAHLAVRYAQQPASLASAGKSLSWPERVAQWNRIAAGEIPAGVAAILGTGVARGTRIRRGPAVDYTTGEGDADGA
jgi:hypothetical protein